MNNPIRYRLAEGEHPFFELDPSLGLLSVKQPLDREASETGEAFFIKIIVRICLRGRALYDKYFLTVNGQSTQSRPNKKYFFIVKLK